MSDATEATGRDSLGRVGTPSLVFVRLAIGLAQGAALWWLYHSTDGYTALCRPGRTGPCAVADWPASVPELFGPLTLIFVMVPVLALAGVGRMRRPTLLLWLLAATAFLALLGWHGVAGQSADSYGDFRYPPFLPWPMPLFAATALFIGHHLVLPADMERRWIAAFPTYFDTAWKAGVQLALSIGFTGAFWLLLFLGSALFKVIGLEFLEDLIEQRWFSIPVTCLMFATAVHLTDVRDGLIRGVRSVVLMLLSWLLLLMTVLAAGFLAALPFTGLDKLWGTGSAAALVLSAAAALIVLINTAYQDGRADNLPPVVLRVTVRIAAVLLTPLVILAFGGLALRIGQHGLTPDRIIAFACALIGAAYAGGYGYAALKLFWRKGADWMQPLERTNVVTAVLEVAVILALFSPLADPARLAVTDQVARLERGTVAPDKFDYRFLRFDSGKAGIVALNELARSTNPEIARRATMAKTADRYDFVHEPRREQPDPADLRIRVASGSEALPKSFTEQYARFADILGHCDAEKVCVARQLDLDRDGVNEVLVAGEITVSAFKHEADGRWFEWAEYRRPSCKDRHISTAFDDGDIRTAPPMFPDLFVGDMRLRHQEGETECPVDSED